jgi:hypothetical protein
MSITFMGMLQFSIAMFFLFVIPYGIYRYVQKQWNEAQQLEGCIWEESEEDFQKRVRQLQEDYVYLPKYTSFEETSEDYKDLVERVEQIDAKAAEYLRTRALQLPDAYTSSVGDYGTLFDAIYWDHTEQGYEYWEELATKLGEV